MAAFAAWEDVQGLWRTLTDAERIVAENHLAFASSVIRQQVPDIDERIADETLDAELVKNVAASMVLRVMRNPDGKLEEQVDDYRYRRDSAVSTGEMYLTAAELQLLKRRRSGAFSIAPYRAETTVADYEAVAAVRAQREDWP